MSRMSEPISGFDARPDYDPASEGFTPVTTDEGKLRQLVEYLEEHVPAYADTVAIPWEGTADEVAAARAKANDRAARMPDHIVHASMLVLGAGVDHTLVVQLTERKLHTQHGVRSPQRLLVDILRVSRRDAAERVQAARLLGHWHRPDGSTAPPKHPATAAAVADGEASAEHARVVSKILHKLPESVSDEKRTEAEQTLAELARTATPEDILNAGHHLLAHLDPDGSLTDERDRRRRRSVYLRGQGADLMSRFSGELDPTARAMFDVILAKWARPGMNNPADPDSPTGDCDAPSVNRDALVAAARSG